MKKEIKEWQQKEIIERYMRYCKDLWLLFHSAWRNKIEELNLNEK